MEEFLKDNPLEGVFDFDENPNVKIRSHLLHRGNGEIWLTQIDARLIRPLNLAFLDVMQGKEKAYEICFKEPYFSRILISFDEANSEQLARTFYGSSACTSTFINGKNKRVETESEQAKYCIFSLTRVEEQKYNQYFNR